MTGILRASLLGIVLLTAAADTEGPPTARQLLDQANESLYRSEIQSYEAFLLRAVQASGAPQDHTDAVVALANDYWRIRKNPTRARDIIFQVLSAKTAPLRASLELARMETAEAYPWRGDVGPPP